MGSVHELAVREIAWPIPDQVPCRRHSSPSRPRGWPGWRCWLRLLLSSESS